MRKLNFGDIFHNEEEGKITHHGMYHYFRKFQDVEEYKNAFGMPPTHSFSGTIESFYDSPESNKNRFVIVKNEDVLNEFEKNGFLPRGKHEINDDGIIMSYLFKSSTIVNIGYLDAGHNIMTGGKFHSTVVDGGLSYFMASIGIISSSEEDYLQVTNTLYKIINSLKIYVPIRYNFTEDDTIYTQRIIVKDTNGGGYRLKNMEIQVDVNNIEDSYDTNPTTHYELINSYNEHVNKFMVMYNGVPGTGKTYFLKYLSYQFSKHGYIVISIPSGLVARFLDPEFVSFVSSLVNDYKKVVFKLEDCESILYSRDSDKQTKPDNVSTLLNLIDGDTFFSSDAKVIFFCTFNTNVDNIDPALMRSGRLFYRYEFKPLSVAKTNAIFDKYKLSHSDTPLTVAEIYEKVNLSKNSKLNDILAKLKDETKNI